MGLGSLAVIVSLVYAAGFLMIARLGRDSTRPWPAPLRRTIYALSSCVAFGFWSSFGVVGLASRRGLDFLPLALGPIAIFAVFYPVFIRMIRISRSQRITSIADFIAVRYGRSVSVAAIVALISLFACIPFISIQIQAIAHALTLVSKDSLPAVASAAYGPPLIVSFVVGALTISVGTLRVDSTESQGGLMVALAAETVVRLLSGLALGLFVCWGLFKGIDDLTAAVARDPAVAAVVRTPPTLARWLPMILVTMAATLVLPRQFHVAIVENRNEEDVRFAGWFVPACILGASLFVLPVAVAGLARLPAGSIDRNFTLLALPMASGSVFMSIVATILCLSASVGTMVISVVALSVMTSNDVVVPLLLWSASKLGGRGRTMVRPILAIRRIAVAGTIAAAAAIAVGFGDGIITTIGLKPIVLMVQIAPAAIGALVWSGGTARGAIGGMLAGVAAAAYTLILPAMVPHDSALLTLGPLGIDALRPTDLLGVDLAPLQQGVVWSLAINVCVFVAVSLTRQPTAGERLQANIFVRAKAMTQASSFRLRNANVSIGELTATTARFLGPETADRLLRDYHFSRGILFETAQAAEPALLQHAEQLIATTIGAASARLVISLLLEQKEMSRDAARQIVDDAAFEIQNSRDLLQHAIDIARDGMAIFDADLRLVAWNRAYRDMFQFTSSELRIGVPLETLIRSNAERGVYGRDGEMEEVVVARLDTLAQPTLGLRMLNAPAGRVLELRSVRLHNGGIFYTYSDATAQAQSEEELEAENETLELRVRERTEQLVGLNMELARAKADAEDANITKSRFLAAASHDVLQPLSAARLYASSLRERLRGRDGGTEMIGLAANVDQSLGAVEDVVRSLLEISQLDARATKTEISDFDLGSLFEELRIDFEPMAMERELDLTFVATALAVRSDRMLLRRLLQNLVSNALKYTPEGRVLVGARRVGGRARIEVIDTGVGIPENKLKLVFREFERLPRSAQMANGAGLGLSIVERLGRVLGHAIAVRSVVGRGSAFAVTLPRASAVVTPLDAVAPAIPRHGLLDGLVVAAVDNEPAILAGLEALLQGWGCVLAGGIDFGDLEKALAARGLVPDVVIADYHIDDVDGLGVIAALRERYGDLPAVLVTADHSSAVRELARRADVRLIHKPLKPATLRALLGQWRLVKTAAE